MIESHYPIDLNKNDSESTETPSEINSSKFPNPKASFDEVEQQVWEVIRQIPGINVGYGSLRLVIYIGKGNREESLSSAVGVVKGLVETAAIAGSVFIAPIITPIAAGALTGIVTESIKGVAHLVVFVIEHPDELRKSDNDHREKVLYNEVKGIPGIGSAYSAARTPVYLLKGDTPEAKLSGVNSILGGVNTAVSCGVGMLTMLDKETQKVIQIVSKSIVQSVSRRVLEKVAKKEITLQEGVDMVRNVEEKCETLGEITAIEEDEGSGADGEEGFISENRVEVEATDNGKVRPDLFSNVLNQDEDFGSKPVSLESESPKKKSYFKKFFNVLRCRHEESRFTNLTDDANNVSNYENFDSLEDSESDKLPDQIIIVI